MDSDSPDSHQDLMAPINAMRMVRAQFLDVAIQIEADLRLMLVDYFLTETGKIELFWDCYEQGTMLGSVVTRFKKVLDAEREALAAQHDFSDQQVVDLKDALGELRQIRNRFAHEAMSQHHEVDAESRSVVRSEWRIGQFTIESATEAYEKARACEDLVIGVRLPLERAARRSRSANG